MMLNKCRVVDLTDEKGLLCSHLLAGLGAEVIRIEKPGAATSFRYENTGKHLISLNIENAQGRDLFQKIIHTADVMVESFPPGYLESLGLGYTELHQLHPQLIVASITPFGQSGPYRDFQSSDLVSAALGGQMYVCGEPDQPPLKPYGCQPDYTASLFAANGILLALWKRSISHEGQHLDISIHECVAATLDHVLVRYFSDGTVAGRRGDLYWNNAFRVFPSHDGYILLTLTYQWDTLVELLASEGLAEDLTQKRWLEDSERQKNLNHIIEVLEKWSARHRTSELVELGQLMHFPWAPAASIPEVVNSPQLNARGFFIQTVDPATQKSHKFPGAPVKISQMPWSVSPHAAEAGEYNHRIYHDELHLTEAEIVALHKEGVI